MPEKNIENLENKRSNENLSYVNFHLHTNFSNLKLLDAYGTVAQHVDYCHSIGYPGVAITDHGSVSGHLELIRLCKEKGIKPICGCEMYATDDLEEMKKVRDKIESKKTDEQETDEYQEYKEDEKTKAKRKMHFNVLAKNQKGLLRLWELVTKSWSEGFYSKPTIDWKNLSEDSENLFFGTACEGGPLGRTLDSEKYKHQKKIELVKRNYLEKNNEIEEEIIKLENSKNPLSVSEKIKELKENISKNQELENAEILKLEKEYVIESKNALRQKLKQLKDLFGENLYVEIIPIPEERARWKYLWSFEIAKELGVLCIGTNDAHAPSKEDTKYQDILYCTNLRRSQKNIRYNDPERKRYTPELFYNHSAEEMFERLKSTFPEFTEQECKNLVNNTMIIFNQIEEVNIPKVPAVAYEELTDVEGERPTNLYQKMLDLIQEGWKFRRFDETLTSEQKVIYKARVKRELEVILNKGYIDYFMIMRDIMNWCETDRPFIEHFEKWFKLNAAFYYPGKSKEEVYEIVKSKGLLSPKKPIATGIARGSAGGSLVTYLLRITNIDPMPFDLLFERFIDYTRGNVYYNLNFNNYSKPKFLKEFTEENKDRLQELENQYKPILVERIKKLLENDKWYNSLQIKREFWLLDHNQPFSREKEYFYTLFEKIEKGEISASNKNESNSILSWLAGITSVEPKGDYVVNLTDIPDIDSDFEDKRRNEVYYYLIHRYGIHNSCRIATYGEVKDKSGLDMLVRIFADKDPDDEKGERVHPEVKKDIKIIKEKIEEYKKVVDVKSTLSIKKKHVKGFLETIEEEYKEKYPWIWEYWEPMFGQIIAMGMHAAGIIVHNKPIVQYGPMYIAKDKETGENLPLIAWDKIDSEAMGLMKLDILGLNTCGNIREVKELVTERHGWEHNWQMIPGIYEDKKTKELLKKGDVTGLFQLEGGTMNGLTNHLEPENLEEVILINAGGRPGPLEYIHSLQYKDKKKGLIKPFYFDNEIYEKITKDRYGLLIYQEDIMAISREMCKYNPYMVGKIRKMVGKATMGGLDELEEDFKSRLKEHSNMSDENAQQLWNYIKSFGTYCFNKAHAAAYALLAWIQGYYKANYPLEFYAGTLKTLPENSEEKIYLLLKDYKNHGYKLLPPDINQSKINFEISKIDGTMEEGIRTGFMYIKGLGKKQSEEIQRKQPFENYKDFIKKIDKRVVNSKIRQLVKDVGMFNSIGGAPLVEEVIVPAIEFIENVIDLPELLEDIFSEYSKKALYNVYLEIGVKEKKKKQKDDEDDDLNKEYKENGIEEDLDEELYDYLPEKINIEIFKTIISKIKTKVKALNKGIEKGELQKIKFDFKKEHGEKLESLLNELDEAYKGILLKASKINKVVKQNETERLEILKIEDEKFGYLEDIILKIEKVKWKKENLEKGILEGLTRLDKEVLLEALKFLEIEIPQEITKDIFSNLKDNILEKFDIEYNLALDSLLIKIEKTQPEKFEKILEIKKENDEKLDEIKTILIQGWNNDIKIKIQEISNIGEEILRSLNINQGNQIVNIDNEIAIKYCPILLNVDISKYAPIIKYFKAGAYQPLKRIDFIEEIPSGITAGMVMEVNVLPEQPTKFKKRVHLVLMVGEYQKSVFVNGASYDNNQEFFDNLKVADTVIISFKKSSKFPVISVNHIFSLPLLYDKVINKKGEITSKEMKLFN